MKHFLKLSDFNKDELLEIFELAKKFKSEVKENIFKNYLPNKILAMIFEKSSTRTRVSFEVGIKQLGGDALFLSKNDIQLGRGEPIKDTSRVISRMCDLVMMRTYSQQKLEEFATFSSIPVINGLTDEFHPVQLMADYLTIIENNLEKDLVVAYVGDGNNMAHSWLNLAGVLGFELRIATPKGYEVDKDILNKAKKLAKISGAKIIILNNPKDAVENASVVTTDTWVSMGQEDEKEKRIKDFSGFMVDNELLNLAKKEAIFLHCLPAYRGYEVSEEVFEKYGKIIFDEAENRLHVQKAIMVYLMNN